MHYFSWNDVLFFKSYTLCPFCVFFSLVEDAIVCSLSPTVYSLRKRIHNWGHEHTIASSTREKSTCTSCTRINGTSDIMKQCTDSLSLSLTAVANVGHRVLFLVKWCALFLNRVLFLVKWCALFEIMYSLSILCVLFSSVGCNRELSVSNCLFFEKRNTQLGTESTRLHPPLEKRIHVQMYLLYPNLL